MDSNTQDALLYDAHKKSTGIAYLLWFLVGWSGAHYFYIGNVGVGVARLLLTIFTIVFFVLIFVSAASAAVSSGGSREGLAGAALVFLILTIISGFVQFVWSIAEIFILHVMVTSRNLRVIENLRGTKAL